MNFIKSHKVASVIVLICLILFVVAGMAFYKMMFPSSADDVNGDRLVNAVAVDEAVVNQIISELEKSDEVSKVTYNKNVRILKFFITTKEGTKLDSAKKLPKVIQEKLSSEVLKYYDVEVFLKQDNNDEYPAIGYLFKGSKDFSWNGVGKNE